MYSGLGQMNNIDAPIKSFMVQGIDGTNLKVYQAGEGYHRWLLPPGLGTPVSCWKYLFEHFKEKMTIVTWDPRGCYGSEVPEHPERLSLENHVDDALSILEALDWSEGTFISGGWSMGVEISLELYHRIPDRITALTLINGTYEHVLQTAFNFPKAGQFFRGLLSGMVVASPVIAPLSSYLLKKDWAVDFLKTLSIVTNNEDYFGDVMKDFADLDFGPYFEMILRLDEHSAKSILKEVEVPTLITAGTLDKMTPMSTAQYMHEQIRNSELFLVPNGTHYTTIEYPEIVNLKLEDFFRNRVYGKSWENPK